MFEIRYLEIPMRTDIKGAHCPVCGHRTLNSNRRKKRMLCRDCKYTESIEQYWARVQAWLADRSRQSIAGDIVRLTEAELTARCINRQTRPFRLHMWAQEIINDYATMHASHHKYEELAKTFATPDLLLPILELEGIDVSEPAARKAVHAMCLMTRGIVNAIQLDEKNT